MRQALLVLVACGGGRSPPPPVVETPAATPATTPARGPTVKALDPTIEGPLTNDVVTSVVAPHVDELRRCYVKELAANGAAIDALPASADGPKLEGQLVVKFKVATDGSVVAAENTTILTTNVNSCMINMVMDLRFPSPSTKATISYPFEFSR